MFLFDKRKQNYSFFQEENSVLFLLSCLYFSNNMKYWNSLISSYFIKIKKNIITHLFFFISLFYPIRTVKRESHFSFFTAFASSIFFLSIQTANDSPILNSLFLPAFSNLVSFLFFLLIFFHLQTKVRKCHNASQLGRLHKHKDGTVEKTTNVVVHDPANVMWTWISSHVALTFLFKTQLNWAVLFDILLG